MKGRVELLLWLITFSEKIGQEIFDSITVAGDSIFEALTAAEKELARQKRGNMVITSATFTGEAVAYPPGES